MVEQDFEAQIARQAAPLLGAFVNLYVNEFETDYEIEGLHFWLNHSKLLSAVKSYLIDIGRMVTFHNLKVADDPKKAAYLVKWILKEQPIVYSGEPGKEQAVINELFAIRISTLLIGVEFGRIPLETRALIIYTFRYRNYDVESFLVFFDYLWRVEGPAKTG